MVWEVKFPLRRYGVYQVILEISLQGSTGSHVGSHQLPGLEHQIEEQDDMWTGFFCTERDSGVSRPCWLFTLRWPGIYGGKNLFYFIIK